MKRKVDSRGGGGDHAGQTGSEVLVLPRDMLLWPMKLHTKAVHDFEMPKKKST